MDKISIKQSIEYKYYYRNALMCSIVFIILLIAQILIYIIPPILDKQGILDMDEIDFNLSFMFLIIIIFPFVVFYIYKCIYLLKNYNKYIYIEVDLNKPRSCEYKRSRMYFEIEIPRLGESNLKKETASIFSTSSDLFAPYFDDYVNKKITIGYQEDNDYVIVIGNV